MTQPNFTKETQKRCNQRRGIVIGAGQPTPSAARHPHSRCASTLPIRLKYHLCTTRSSCGGQNVHARPLSSRTAWPTISAAAAAVTAHASIVVTLLRCPTSQAGVAEQERERVDEHDEHSHFRRRSGISPCSQYRSALGHCSRFDGTPTWCTLYHARCAPAAIPLVLLSIDSDSR